MKLWMFTDARGMSCVRADTVQDAIDVVFKRRELSGLVDCREIVSDGEPSELFFDENETPVVQIPPLYCMASLDKIDPKIQKAFDKIIAEIEKKKNARSAPR